MIQVVQEGVELYLREAREYIAFTKFLSRADFPVLDSEERRLYGWNEKLKGMEQALGLTPEEVKLIQKGV